MLALDAMVMCIFDKYRHKYQVPADVHRGKLHEALNRWIGSFG